MFRSMARVALLLVLSLGFAPGAWAELQAWDQEKVTALAGELEEKTGILRQAVRRETPTGLPQRQRRAWHNLRDELGAIESAAGRLHRAVQAGESQEETLPTYRRLMSSVSRARDERSRVNVLEPIEGKIEAAAAVLRQLQPFYDESAPLE
jgi:hypothetical protein